MKTKNSDFATNKQQTRELNKMAIKVYDNLLQGTDEWHALRCGLLTASEMKYIITPTYKLADNDKTRMHLYELLAQRITNHVEPSYISDDMLRGLDDEDVARDLYNEKNPQNPAREVGFITNDSWGGFTLGYSPDGLVGKNGAIEIKSRNQKFQVQTIIGWEIPKEHDIQIQSAMIVAGLEWIDYVQYSNGMPMATIRAYPDMEKQTAILKAAALFEEKLNEMLEKYTNRLEEKSGFLVPTKRREGGMI